jgi:hypothetical protein
MATPAQLQPYVFGVLAIFIVWRVYSRVRRLVGRQRLSPLRSWIQIVFFAILILALLAGSLAHPVRSVSELTGVGLGIALAIYGLRLTAFEDTAQGRFYTPNRHIGLALSSLFVGRLAYKLIAGYTHSAGFTQPPVDLVKSPMTLFIVGTLAGYYAAYAIGLLRWRSRCIALAGRKAGRSLSSPP